MQPWRSSREPPPSSDSTGSRSKPAHRAPSASTRGRRISSGSSSINASAPAASIAAGSTSRTSPWRSWVEPGCHGRIAEEGHQIRRGPGLGEQALGDNLMTRGFERADLAVHSCRSPAFGRTERSPWRAPISSWRAGSAAPPHRGREWVSTFCRTPLECQRLDHRAMRTGFHRVDRGRLVRPCRSRPGCGRRGIFDKLPDQAGPAALEE